MTASDLPIERDFLASARLNYLHVHFLLHLSQNERIKEPSHHLLSVSAEMLSLVVEAAVLKEQLLNSGTGIVWRVSCFSLRC